MSFRITLSCTRAEGERIAQGGDDLFTQSADPPVIVADEPDPDRPDEWLIHAYFEHRPDDLELKIVQKLGSGTPIVEELAEADWVTMSQAGLHPIRAGRFYVHTPTHRNIPPGTVSFEIDAGLAFGTGQHATTSNCLEALDRLERAGANFSNIADIGTGTGILAFASLALWPRAKCLAADIDATAIDVAKENALINGFSPGHGPGELLFATADGMDSPLILARSPFDLLIANILAGPLIGLATAFADALEPNGVIILAGLLESQLEAVTKAYENEGLSVRERGFGEWPALVCERPL